MVLVFINAKKTDYWFSLIWSRHNGTLFIKKLDLIFYPNFSLMV